MQSFWNKSQVFFFFNYYYKCDFILKNSLANDLWNSMTYEVSVQFSSVQSLSRVRLFVTPWIAARQASLSITSSRRSLRLTSIESVMPSSHLILCLALLPLPTIPPSIRVFSNESTLRMRWPKYWSFSFSIIPSKEYPRLQLFLPFIVDSYYSAFAKVIHRNTSSFYLNTLKFDQRKRD